MAVVDSITDVLIKIGLAENLNALIKLERSMFDFRRLLWWRTTGVHGHANALLDAYHSAHDLPERVTRLIADVADASRLAQATEAARTNAALAVISVIGVPFGVCYAAAALFTPHQWNTFFISTGIAVVLSVVLGMTGPMRSITEAWRRDRSD
jgi:hypothetical protein